MTGEYPPDVGGLADYTARLRAALRARGRRVAVLTRQGPGRHQPGVARAVERWNTAGVARLPRQAPPGGIVHLQYQAAAFDLLGDICLVPMLLRLSRRDVHVATTFHDVRVPYVFPKAGPLRPLLLRLLARTSDAVLAADWADLTWLGGPSPRHHLVPIGSNLARQPPPGYNRAGFRAGLGLQPSDLAIAYFGLLNSSKGLATLLATFRSVQNRNPGTWLLLLGGALGASDATDARTAADFQRRLGAAQRVIQPGYGDNETLSAYLLAADVALLPYADGASARRASLLACAEHGLPIVTTSGPGLDNRGAHLAGSVLACPPGDAAGLAEAVHRVADDAALRRGLAARSAALAGRVSWAAIADRHLALYDELADGAAGGRTL